MTRGRAGERGGSKNVVLVVAAVLLIRISIGVVACSTMVGLLLLLLLMMMMAVCAKHVAKASSARLCFVTLQIIGCCFLVFNRYKTRCGTNRIERMHRVYKDGMIQGVHTFGSVELFT